MSDSIDVMCLALEQYRIPPELRCIEMPFTVTRETTGCVYIMSRLICGLAGLRPERGTCDYINRGDVSTPAD